MRQPIDEAIRQLEVELSLLKNRLPNRGSENSVPCARTVKGHRQDRAAQPAAWTDRNKSVADAANQDQR